MKRTFPRRWFLKAGLASAAIIPSRVLGAQAPSKQVNLALIGCGGRMNALRSALRNIPEARILAAVDPFRDRREAVAREINGQTGQEICKPLEDYREALSNPDIDAVVIATPDQWHVPIALAAARARKDIYLEKPLGLSMPDAALLRDEIRRHKLVFQYGTQQHSSPSGRQAVELVWNGYVGKIQRVDVVCPALGDAPRAPITEEPVPDGLNYDFWLGPAKRAPYSAKRVSKEGAWHCYDYALGFIAGWGAHPLDMLQWGLRTEDTAPVAYRGSGYLPPEPGLFDTVRSWDVEMEYADGMGVRFLDAHTAAPIIKPIHRYMKGNEVIWHGTEGFVCHTRGAAYVKRNGSYENVGTIDFSEFPHRAAESPDHMKNFVDCVISREDPVSTIEAAVHSDSISHLANIAVRTGKAVAYDPSKLRITGDADLDAMLTRPVREGFWKS